MQLKFGLSAALLIAVVPAFAQPQDSSESQSAGPEGQIQQAAMAFGQCIAAGVQGLAPTVAPEAGASSVMGGCTEQRAQLEQAVEAVIATLPAEQQAMAREQARTQLAEAETQIADAIREERAEMTASEE